MSTRPQLLVLLFALVVAVQQLQAAMHYSPNTVVVDGKCYHTRRKMFIEENEVVQLPKCRILTCSVRYNKLTLGEETCGKIDRECRVPGDPTLPYPDCCPTSKCTFDEFGVIVKK